MLKESLPERVVLYRDGAYYLYKKKGYILFKISEALETLEDALASHKAISGEIEECGG